MEELFAGSPFDLPYQVTMFMSMYHSLVSVLTTAFSALSEYVSSNFGKHFETARYS